MELGSSTIRAGSYRVGSDEQFVVGETMNRPIVNIDLDNVVYDFNKAMHDYAQEILGRELPESTVWNQWEPWGITKGAWKFLFRRGVEDGGVWLNGDVVPGAVEGLWVLSDDEWHIRLLTNRLAHNFGHDIAVEHTVKWLKRYAVPYRSLSVIGYGDVKSNYRAITLVDDNLDNVKDWNDNAGGAEEAILFDQPWNHASPATAGYHGMRAYTWDDVVGRMKVYGRDW